MLTNRAELREMNKNCKADSDNLRELVGFHKCHPDNVKFTLDVANLSVEAEMEALLTCSVNNYAQVLCIAGSRTLDYQHSVDNFGSSSKCIDYILNHASVEPDVFKRVTMSTTQADNYISENAGNIAVLLENFDKGKGLQKFLKNQFASSVREEIAGIVTDFNKYSAVPFSDSITTTVTEGLDQASYTEPEN